MTEKDQPIEAICRPVKPGHVLITSKRPFESLLSLCEKFHGETSVVRSERMQQQLSKPTLLKRLAREIQVRASTYMLSVNSWLQAMYRSPLLDELSWLFTSFLRHK